MSFWLTCILTNEERLQLEDPAHSPTTPSPLRRSGRETVDDPLVAPITRANWQKRTYVRSEYLRFSQEFSHCVLFLWHSAPEESRLPPQPPSTTTAAFSDPPPVCAWSWVVSLLLLVEKPLGVERKGNVESKAVWRQLGVWQAALACFFFATVRKYQRGTTLIKRWLLTLAAVGLHQSDSLKRATVFVGA